MHTKPLKQIYEVRIEIQHAGQIHVPFSKEKILVLGFDDDEEDKHENSKNVRINDWIVRRA